MTISIENSRTESITNSVGAVREMITGPDVYQPLKETSHTTVAMGQELQALEAADELGGLRVADFGSGTGQNAVWAKFVFPGLEVHAYDNDPNAEKYILANAELYNVDITTHIMDVADISNDEEFDIVLSNPPYYPAILKTLHLAGSHSDDPDSAVYGGVDGTDVQAVFIAKAGNVLKSGGFIVAVHSRPQKEAVYTMLIQNGFGTPVTYDLANVADKTDELDLVNAVFTVAYKN
jgi:release factor glutamine methyltransferase